jgi:hypothetical protein
MWYAEVGSLDMHLLSRKPDVQHGLGIAISFDPPLVTIIFGHYYRNYRLFSRETLRYTYQTCIYVCHVSYHSNGHH